MLFGAQSRNNGQGKNQGICPMMSLGGALAALGFCVDLRAICREASGYLPLDRQPATPESDHGLGDVLMFATWRQMLVAIATFGDFSRWRAARDRLLPDPAHRALFGREVLDNLGLTG